MLLQGISLLIFLVALGHFDRRPVGEISTRLSELGSIRGFLTGTALTLVLDVIFGTIYFFVLISYSGLSLRSPLCDTPLLSYGLYRGAVINVNYVSLPRLMLRQVL